MQPMDAYARAEAAAVSVVTVFNTDVRTGTLARLRGTRADAALAARAYPHPDRRDTTWHYWWQAHYLDAVVDAGLRHLGDGRAREYAALAESLLRGVWTRNGRRWNNDFYDDMAWLSLAAQRTEALAQAADGRGCEPATSALTALGPYLLQSITDDMGGGCFWSCSHDFKNTPATAPIALWLARSGRSDDARRLMTWLAEHLVDDSGLVLDGMHWENDAPKLERTIYSYNQGTVLGALLALGEPEDLARAAALIAAIGRGLRDREGGPLRTHGGGDGGLFTGILCRYLAAAARDERLDDGTRAGAAGLIRATADAFWAGAEQRRVDRDSVIVFSSDAVRPAAETYPAGQPIELGTQVQAWTTLEAAATLV